MTDQEKFMREAIRQAKKAYLLEEVPIGSQVPTHSLPMMKNCMVIR